MSTNRYSPSATLLPNGKVLVAGGVNTNNPSGSTNFLSSAELYDPATGTWTKISSMNTNRSRHTVTLLPNGKVLIAGGVNNYNAVSGSIAITNAELFDPVAGTWTKTGGMNTNRGYHTATLLPSGKVLVAGGVSGVGNAYSSAELYDPATGIWTKTSSMNTNRGYHTATLLPNGKVLIAGGANKSFNSGESILFSAELYDPATGTWTNTSSMSTNHSAHTATLLPNGKVLVAGGLPIVGPLNLPNTELYDPASGTWTNTSLMRTNRYWHTATLLPNGKVMVAGGINALSSVELYDPSTGTWTNNSSMKTNRYAHTATLLSNGKVLVAGGASGVGNAYSSAELYNYLPLVVVQAPSNSTNILGDNVSLSLSVTGETPMAFQFYFSATNIYNGTNSTLTLTNLPASFFGYYYVVVTNVYECITSSVAAIYLAGAPTLTVRTGGSGAGSVAVNPLKAYYLQGDTVTLTATALGATNQFAHWSGDAIGTTNQLLLSMDTNKVLTANFVAGLPPLQANLAAGQPQGLSLNLTGLASQRYVLQCSTNLAGQWQSLLTNTAGLDGVWQFTETNFDSGQKYYRVTVP